MERVKTVPGNTTPLVPPQSADHLPESGFQPMSSSSTEMRTRHRKGSKRAMAILRHHAPAILEKAGMSTIPDSGLRPFQLATRQIRNELLSEIDNPSSIQRHLVGMCVTDLIIIETIDQYIGELANNGGIINRAEHDIYPIVEKVVVLKNMLARRMKMIGIRHTPKTKNVMEDTLAKWNQDRLGKGTPLSPSPVKVRKKKTESSHQTGEDEGGKGKFLGGGGVVADGPADI